MRTDTSTKVREAGFEPAKPPAPKAGALARLSYTRIRDNGLQRKALKSGRLDSNQTTSRFQSEYSTRLSYTLIVAVLFSTVTYAFPVSTP